MKPAPAVAGKDMTGMQNFVSFAAHIYKEARPDPEHSLCQIQPGKCLKLFSRLKQSLIKNLSYQQVAGFPSAI